MRTCRECGCTERRACYRPDQGPCWWVERDLCSHCARPWKAEAVQPAGAEFWAAAGLFIFGLSLGVILGWLMGKIA